MLRCPDFSMGNPSDSFLYLIPRVSVKCTARNLRYDRIMEKLECHVEGQCFRFIPDESRTLA